MAEAPTEIARRYAHVRARTEQLAEPLSPEDQQLQAGPSCSPTKWHRAHTTWFFETFVLQPRGVRAFDPDFAYLFNSYYETLGPRHARPQRGLLSRPDAARIAAYRAAVDARMADLLGSLDPDETEALRPLLELGLAHEEQHQELILTDILEAFAANPTRPAYAAPTRAIAPAAATPMGFVTCPGGLVEIGARAGAFAFDNEGPRHRVFLAPYALADRLVTVGEVKAFVADGAYRRASLWLADGMEWVRAHGLDAPLHARIEGDAYVTYTLAGERVASDAEPAAHLSYYEADALARWLGGRLPTEAEWEHAADGTDGRGNFLGDGPLRPQPARGTGVRQLFGDLWEWTASAYSAYPGYAPAAGAVGEYNGKFMANQFVLRGGSFATPPGHVRASYRNFWRPDTRFQFTGVRVARDA